MRLWHKDLIEVLPDKQLVGQWRECCLIGKAIHNANLNHLLVNKVKNYPLRDFVSYTALVYFEMKHRGYNPIWRNFQLYTGADITVVELSGDIFNGWHNNRYLKQCFYNLQEKYDCGGMSRDEFAEVCQLYAEKMPLENP